MADQQVVARTISSSSGVQTATTFSQSSTSSTNVVKSGSSTTTKTVSSTKKMATTIKKSSSTMKSTTASKMVSIKSSGERFSDTVSKHTGLDMNKEIERLSLEMHTEMNKARQQALHLLPLEAPSSPTSLIKLDSSSLMNFVDKEGSHDNLKFNFDVQEFESETISVKTVGNKIEVHGQKRVKKGDEERTEEYSRSYELPTKEDVDPGRVTSSFYKDGVLTVQLPVNAAIQG